MSRESKRDRNEMRPEYDIRGGVRGKYYERYRQGTNVIVLDPQGVKGQGVKSALSPSKQVMA